MKLVVGLGNPGNEYNFTRHNFGFLALDFYAKVHGLDWEVRPKFDALWLKVGQGAEQVIFLKPQTFYNNSGHAVQAFAHYYKVPVADALVICDDFNLPFGTLRYRIGGSDGGNNGLKSTIQELGTNGFPRLRLGTGSQQRARLGDTDFVLGRFTEEERQRLPEILKEAAERVDELIR